MKRLLALGLALAMSSACGAQGLQRNSDPLAKYDGYIGEPVKSFNAFRIDSWQPVDKDELILWTGINTAYLIKVTGFCPDLPFAQSIAVDNKGIGNTISTYDYIIVRRDRCPIEQINPINVKQYKADRKADQESAAKESANKT